jgi:uncharacterized membrane protein
MPVSWRKRFLGYARLVTLVAVSMAWYGFGYLAGKTGMGWDIFLDVLVLVSLLSVVVLGWAVLGIANDARAEVENKDRARP